VQWLDLMIIGIIAWFTFSAFSNGLIREVMTIAAVMLGGLLAGHFYGDLSNNISFLIEDSTTRNLVAFISLFAGVVVLGQLAATFAKGAASMLMLGPLDHMGGAVFGFVKGVVVVEVLVIGFAVFPAATGMESAVRDSTLAPMLLHAVPLALHLLPAEFADRIAPFV
jgi:membrane protein required for colicin V production